MKRVRTLAVLVLVFVAGVTGSKIVDSISHPKPVHAYQGLKIDPITTTVSNTGVITITQTDVNGNVSFIAYTSDLVQAQAAWTNATYKLSVNVQKQPQ